MTGPEPVAGSAGGIGRRREHAAGAVAGAAAGVLLGFLLGDRGVWVVAISVGALVAALVALAVSGERHRRSATAVAVALGLLVAGSLAALLALAGRVGESPWPGGVPLALWVLFGVLWLVPLLVTGLGYALTFELPVVADRDERDEPGDREEAP